MKQPSFTNSQRLLYTPKGYHSFVTSAGIKKNDSSLDLGIIYSEVKCNASAVFTKNKVKGHSIIIGKKHIKDKKLQAVIVNSKNANVATGKQGYQNAKNICKKIAKELNIDSADVLPSSTGVIGRQLPIEKILTPLKNLKTKLIHPPDFSEFAKSIMTTDTFPKYISRKVEGASIVAVAKGSGMIQPNMATMLSYFFTDAKISSKKLEKILKQSVDASFNSLSIDTDTSTSDTVCIMANGLAGKVNEKKFAQTIKEMSIELTKKLAFDAEGATKLFTVNIRGARNKKEAKQIGKSIINSPLVKTAIYQGDPNWGRIFMAIGKTPDVKINQNKIEILWGHSQKRYKDNELDKLEKYLRNAKEVILTIDLHLQKPKKQKKKFQATVYGCDLTEEYVKINAYYTT